MKYTRKDIPKGDYNADQWPEWALSKRGMPDVLCNRIEELVPKIHQEGLKHLEQAACEYTVSWYNQLEDRKIYDDAKDAKKVIQADEYDEMFGTKTSAASKPDFVAEISVIKGAVYTLYERLSGAGAGCSPYTRQLLSDALKGSNTSLTDVVGIIKPLFEALDNEDIDTLVQARSSGRRGRYEGFRDTAGWTLVEEIGHILSEFTVGTPSKSLMNAVIKVLLSNEHTLGGIVNQWRMNQSNYLKLNLNVK